MNESLRVALRWTDAPRGWRRARAVFLAVSWCSCLFGSPVVASAPADQQSSPDTPAHEVRVGDSLVYELEFSTFNRKGAREERSKRPATTVRWHLISRVVETNGEWATVELVWVREGDTAKQALRYIEPVRTRTRSPGDPRLKSLGEARVVELAGRPWRVVVMRPDIAPNDAPIDGRTIAEDPGPTWLFGGVLSWSRPGSPLAPSPTSAHLQLVRITRGGEGGGPLSYAKAPRLTIEWREGAPPMMSVHREWVEAGFIYGDVVRDVSEVSPHPTHREGLRPRDGLMQRLVEIVLREEDRRSR